MEVELLSFWVPALLWRIVAFFCRLLVSVFGRALLAVLPSFAGLSVVQVHFGSAFSRALSHLSALSVRHIRHWAGGHLHVGSAPVGWAASFDPLVSRLRGFL